MIVRHATPEDLPTLYKLCWAGYRELSPPERVDPDLLWDWVVEAFHQAPQLILVKDGQIIGFWGLCFIKAAWSYDRMLADYMFYILPNHRSLKASRLLVQAVKGIADSFNLTFRQSYLFKGKLALHIRIFQMMGFSVSGLIGFYKGKK